ncbi:hypothetical protein FA09DRAFT_337512 [Tilletiopsis washingtonensis]|uniref:Uncharacterized protein n=1 Tax=Tilletiopsis washingtonensis TaxID=58919 RepID=A0A316ZCF3_9BASI|nr:hypothetical protein FA09DRAFT_337512 [Tilletiopsis washingtonensis]PWN99380.1 hypothetical protein FA09DRAFT_337512 [Tilletiopsis washingtonensis]
MAAPRRAAQPGVGSSVPQPPVVEAPTQPRLGRGLAATALLFAGCFVLFNPTVARELVTGPRVKVIRHEQQAEAFVTKQNERLV